MAVRATRLGALDFLEKPISTDKLLLTVENALSCSVWKAKTSNCGSDWASTKSFGRAKLCGGYGATGACSRERVARVHPGGNRHGQRIGGADDSRAKRAPSGPFVTLNCAAVPAELIESELFGHEKGSFTGAPGRHIGKFEQADQGTIFLDEIGDMPLSMQAKLLRVLEEGEVERIGGDKPIGVDVRVVVATHRDLEARAREEKFRQDLFHRIYVFPLALPPLRDRCEDVPALVEHFAAQVCAQNGWKPVPFTTEAMQALQEHSWPGNVRELRNMVERLMLLATDGQVDLATVQMALAKQLRRAPVVDNLSVRPPRQTALNHSSEKSILAELKRTHQNMSLTAKALGLERSHLYKKAEQLGIDLRALRREQGAQD